jgi:hypothetical protein
MPSGSRGRFTTTRGTPQCSVAKPLERNAAREPLRTRVPRPDADAREHHRREFLLIHGEADVDHLTRVHDHCHPVMLAELSAIPHLFVVDAPADRGAI